MNINKIYLDKNFQTQEEVFRFLSESMQEIGVVDKAQQYLDALRARECESTTGLVNGFAIPHGKSDDIHEAAIIYIRNQSGIEWNSLDGSKITDIFALAIPSESAQEHLDSLIAISTNLMNDAICERLRNAKTEIEVRSIFA